MILTLEVCGPEASSLGAAGRKVFDGTGGLIGRLPNNDWVLPGQYVSGHHARIQFRNGQFLVEDTSTNGVFVNSPDNRLQRGRPYPIKSGDRLFIDMYEISVEVGAGERARDPFVPAQVGGSRTPPVISEDPFSVDAVEAPPAPRGGAHAGGRGLRADASDPFGDLVNPIAATGEADPLKVLGIESKSAPRPPAPRASDLASGSPLSDPYRPPVVRTPKAAEPLTPEPIIPEDPLGEGLIPQDPAPQHGVIPADYDPLAPETSGVASPSEPPGRSSPRTPVPPRGARAPSPAVPPRPSPGPAAARTPPPVDVRSGARQGSVREEPTHPAPLPPPTPAPRASRTPPRQVGPRNPDPFAEAVASQGAGRPQTQERARDTPGSPARSTEGEFDFAAFLQGVGVRGVEVSPELAREFGEVLRVVIAGLMEALRARERIKSEFRLRATTFKPADNNPLKFSANLEDALHNLLLKRNPAYLGPVEAFEDAFRDVRNHQMAMLAGVRVAYEAMLAQFDPGRLQAEFDRQLKKGALIGAPARLKYWELYRERFRDRVRDADSCFRDLFGDEFAKAYEEQLERLRALPRATDK